MVEADTIEEYEVRGDSAEIMVFEEDTDGNQIDRDAKGYKPIKPIPYAYIKENRPELIDAVIAANLAVLEFIREELGYSG